MGSAAGPLQEAEAAYLPSEGTTYLSWGMSQCTQELKPNALKWESYKPKEFSESLWSRPGILATFEVEAEGLQTQGVYSQS